MLIWLKKVEHCKAYMKMGKKKFNISWYWNWKKLILPQWDSCFVKDVECISFGEKNYAYFIGYLYNDNKVKPLYIMLPKRSAYVKSYDG